MKLMRRKKNGVVIVLCECGCSIRRDGMTKHKKSLNHHNIMTKPFHTNNLKKYYRNNILKKMF